MKKRKKWPFATAARVVLLGIAFWYLFMPPRITDAGNEIIAGEDGTDNDSEAVAEPETADGQTAQSTLGYVKEGTEEYRGFVIDNVLHSVNDGDIHYNVYIPESYDGRSPYALYFTLPGYEGLYFQGAAANIQSEEFGFEAMAYNSDTSKVYGSGYSGGGETMSLVLGKRPDLFTAYLHVSSQWDGDLEAVAKQRLPVYLAIGQNDEYYGSAPTQEAYDTLHALYEEQGLSEEEIGGLLVLDIKSHDYFTQRGMNNEHGGGGLFACDEKIMGWLFSHGCVIGGHRNAKSYNPRI